MKCKIVMTVEARDGSDAENVAYALAYHCDMEGWEASEISWETLPIEDDEEK
jgi:hypothetical protein